VAVAPLLLAVQLISPCCCKGTLKFVHQACLHRWQDNVARMGGKRDERATVCGVCRTRYTSLPPKAALHVWRKVGKSLSLPRGNVVLNSTAEQPIACMACSIVRNCRSSFVQQAGVIKWQIGSAHGSQLTDPPAVTLLLQIWGATRGLVGAFAISLLALCLSGPPVLHLALLVLLLLGTRSQSLLAVLLLVLGGVVASLYARGLRLVVRGAGEGDLRFGLALIR
jgi:hypothetical protein